MRKRRRIGILGGSFDPIHVGHLSVAQQAAEKLKLDEVVLVPAGSPPHKRPARLASAEDRLAMARLAVRGLARLSVSDIEVRRPGPSYTLDTVREIKARLGSEHQYFFIIGADTVRELPTWHRAAELLAEVSLAIAVRPGYEPDFGPVERSIGPEAAARLRDGLLDIEPCDVSSTEIRRRLASGGDIGALLRTDVAEHIRRRGLYR
jgi:nicotinate-nucleotide adenylyltransferase